MNGLTAYLGLLDIVRPKAGETVVVSTAAGSVGSCVGQIAKIMGCRMVGIAGGTEKVRLCREEFGFDAAIDDKAGNVDTALAAACPDGVDVYFDNTVGAITDAVMKQLRIGARGAGVGHPKVRYFRLGCLQDGGSHVAARHRSRGPGIEVRAPA